MRAFGTLGKTVCLKNIFYLEEGKRSNPKDEIQRFEPMKKDSVL
jgi:hypothetical protein